MSEQKNKEVHIIFSGPEEQVQKLRKELWDRLVAEGIEPDETYVLDKE